MMKKTKTAILLAISAALASVALFSDDVQSEAMAQAIRIRNAIHRIRDVMHDMGMNPTSVDDMSNCVAQVSDIDLAFSGQFKGTVVAAGDLSGSADSWLKDERNKVDLVCPDLLDLQNKLDFRVCNGIVSISAPNLTKAGTTPYIVERGTFKNCKNLKSVDLPNLVTVAKYSSGDEFLGGCTSLTNLYLPKLETGAGGFVSGCTSLKTINFPVCTTAIGTFDDRYFFGGLSSGCLESLVVPKCTSFSNYDPNDALKKFPTTLTNLVVGFTSSTLLGTYPNTLNNIPSKLRIKITCMGDDPPSIVAFQDNQWKVIGTVDQGE